MSERTETRRPRGRPKTRDREDAIAAAMASYWREGPDGLSLGERCERVGLSKPALYREFGGEDGLLDAALARYGEVRIAPLLAVLEAPRPFAEAVEAFVAWFGSDDEVPAGCLLARVRTSPRPQGPATQARVSTLGDLQRGALVAWVRRAVEVGEAASGLDPELAGRYLDAQITHLLAALSAGEDPALVRAQARLAFAGLLPPCAY